MEYQMSHHFYESRTISRLPKRFLYTILAGLSCLCKKNVPNRKKSARKNFWCRNQNIISCRFGFIYKPKNNLQLFHMKYKGAQAPPVCAENMVFIVNNCKNRNGDVLYFFCCGFIFLIAANQSGTGIWCRRRNWYSFYPWTIRFFRSCRGACATAEARVRGCPVTACFLLPGYRVCHWAFLLFGFSSEGGKEFVFAVCYNCIAVKRGIWRFSTNF